jgi:excisionase family DNA binding protein
MTSSNVKRGWLARAFDPDIDITPWLREHAAGVPIISVGPDKAAESSGIPRVTIFKAIKKGELPAYKCGRRTLIMLPDLASYIRSLPRRKTAMEATQ